MATTIDKLPDDVLSRILQLLPVKELCRFRTLCRSWRSVTSDPAFVEAHADRHKETLFLAKFQDDERRVYVVDLSGNVVKRIAAGADRGHHVLRTSLKLACLASESNTCRLLNPATGRVRVLPLTTALYYVNGSFFRHHCTLFALGFVASTEEYKLLRYWGPFPDIGHKVQVLTTSNGGTNWRSSPVPSCLIDMQSGIVVDGVVYFLTLSHGSSVPPDNILSFDLASEEWRRDLHGPLTSTGNVTSVEVLPDQLSLADLKGSLVLAHYRHHLSTVDLWFLQDFESGLWVKEYSIRTESVFLQGWAGIRHGQIIPLLALDDGRLVFYFASPAGLLFICDPGTNTFTRVHMRGRLDSVGVYTGSLLSRQAEGMV